MMGAPIKLKKDVIPHIFNCQPPRIETSNNQLVYNKLNRKREIAKILSEAENSNVNSVNTLPHLPLRKIRKTENNQVLNSDKIIFVDLTNVSLYISFIKPKTNDYLKMNV